MNISWRKRVGAGICSALIAITPMASAFATVVYPSAGGKWDYGTHGLYEAWSIYEHPTRDHKASVSSWTKNFSSQCVIKKTKAEAHIWRYTGRATMNYGLCDE